MDAGRTVAMASLSPTTFAATTARPSSRAARFGLPKVAAMAAQNPKPASGTRRGTTVFPVGEPGPRQAAARGKASPPVKLLTNVEKLRLLTKAEKAGLLSAAERAGLSLSAVERLGLLSKAEELGALSAATNLCTPGALLGLALHLPSPRSTRGRWPSRSSSRSSASLLLLAAGPAVVYLVPEGGGRPGRRRARLHRGGGCGGAAETEDTRARRSERMRGRGGG